MDANALWSMLSTRGYRKTRNRQKILQVLVMQSGWITAKSLFEELCAQKMNIDFSTVCRNLDILSKMGVLCRVDRDRNGVFAYSLREIEHHHHHLVCISCGKITPMEFCPLKEMSPALTGGYSELECSFEVYGCCQKCQSNR